MYVCMYMYICVCIYVCVCGRMYVYRVSQKNVYTLKQLITQLLQQSVMPSISEDFEDDEFYHQQGDTNKVHTMRPATIAELRAAIECNCTQIPRVVS